jgi:hypothetical protein
MWRRETEEHMTDEQWFPLIVSVISAKLAHQRDLVSPKARVMS